MAQLSDAVDKFISNREAVVRTDTDSLQEVSSVQDIRDSYVARKPKPKEETAAPIKTRSFSVNTIEPTFLTGHGGGGLLIGPRFQKGHVYTMNKEEKEKPPLSGFFERRMVPPRKDFTFPEDLSFRAPKGDPTIRPDKGLDPTPPREQYWANPPQPEFKNPPQPKLEWAMPKEAPYRVSAYRMRNPPKTAFTRELARTADIYAEAGLTTKARSYALLAGLGRVLESPISNITGDPDYNLSTYMQQYYQKEAEELKKSASFIKYEPQGVIDSVNTKVVSGLLQLLDPQLALMGSPGAYGVASALTEYGQGKEVSDSVVIGLESAIIAKGFKLTHGKDIIDAAYRLGSVGATEAGANTFFSGGSLKDSALAGLEGGVTTGVFAAMGASKLGSSAKRVYERYEPMVGHDKALEIAFNVDRLGKDKSSKPLAEEPDVRQRLIDDAIKTAARIGSEVRGDKPTPKPKKVKKTKAKKTKTKKEEAPKDTKEEIRKGLEKPLEPEIPSGQKITEGEKPKEAEKLSAETVTSLANEEYDVIYDGEMEPLGHQITLKPKGMTDAQVMESGKASTIYAKDIEEARTKIDAKIAEYKHAEESKEAVTDVKAKVKIRPIKHPEKSEFYQDRETTEEVTSALEEVSESIKEDPYLYARALINEINRWFHGEDLDIESTRRKLTDLAAEVEILREDFLDQKAINERKKELRDYSGLEGDGKFADEEFPGKELFEDYKLMVEEAAGWARRLRRPKTISEATRKPVTSFADLKELEKGKKAVGGIEFYSGIPVHEIKKLFDSVIGYARSLVGNSDNVQSVKLIGSSTKEKKGADIDLLYDFGTVGLPKDKASVESFIERIIEETVGLDLDKYNTFIKADDRYFHISSGAGRQVVENTSYGREQKDKPSVIIADKDPSKENVTLVSSRGVKLYSGIDPAEVVKSIKKVSGYFARVKQEKERLSREEREERTTKIYRDLKTKFLSLSANLKGDLVPFAKGRGYEVLQDLVLNTGATSRSAHIYRAYEKQVYDGLDARLTDSLNEVIFAMRVRQIAENNPKAKNPFSKEDAQRYIDSIGEAKGLTPDEVQIVHERADVYFDIVRDNLRQMREEGLITEKDYEELSKFDYMRRQLVDRLDPEFTYQLGRKKISVRESGIEELFIGREGEILENDSRALLAELVIRTQNRIMANRAARSLYSLALKDKTNSFVRIKEKNTYQLGDERIKAKSDSLKGWSPVHVFIDGKRKVMYMPEHYASEWVSRNKEMTHKFSDFARVASGSSILRSMATGVNIGFAIKNFFRDFAYMWAYSGHWTSEGGWTSTYSMHLPKALLEMGHDIASVSSDIIFRKGIYDEIARQGVLLDFLSNKEALMRNRIGKAETNVHAVMDALHYISNTSELIGRASLYKRALRKGLSQKEAAFLAKDYLHFGDYGSYTKAIDSVVPYFGATIKATEGIWRSAKRNPTEFAYKASQVMALGALVHMLNQNENPDAYAQVPKYDRQRNFIIPIYMPFTDKDGQKRNLYMKIPKDQGQMFFAALGEFAIDKVRGIENDPDLIITTLAGLSPIQEIPSIPVADAIIGYAKNKDFWTGQDIWNGAAVGKGMFDLENEFKESGPNPTNAALVALGKATGLSPERIKYSLESVFTRGNIYTDAFSHVADGLFRYLPEDQREMVIAEVLARNSVTKGVFGMTNTPNEYRDVIEDVEIDYNIKKLMVDRTTDRLVEQVYKHKTAKPEDIYNHIKTLKDKNERDRVLEDVKFQKEIIDLPDKALWMKLYRLSPEASAEVFYKVLQEASDSRKKELVKQFAKANKAKTIATDRFRKKYGEMMKGGGD